VTTVEAEFVAAVEEMSCDFFAELSKKEQQQRRKFAVEGEFTAAADDKKKVVHLTSDFRVYLAAANSSKQVLFVERRLISQAR